VIHDSQACGEGQAMQQRPVIRKALERIRQRQRVPSPHQRSVHFILHDIRYRADG
jgi:hypothetical protein